MKKETIKWLSKDERTQINGRIWIPDGEIKGILQIVHGMLEYIDRYGEFAEYLCENGYCVVGHDQLGHGSSVESEAEYGYFSKGNGNECLIGDIHTLRKMMEKRYPDVPYFMLGHSMGSFLIRQYMSLHGSGLKGVIVSGTGVKPEIVLAGGKCLCSIQAAFKGWHYRSTLLAKAAFAGTGKRIHPQRTANDWLTKDEAIVDAYNADPLCTFLFTVNGFYEMFRSIQFIQKKANLNRIPKELPIFLIAGAEDPIGDYGKGVERVYQQMQEANIADVTIKLYKDDRHEVLNETDREQVFEDLLTWLESR